VPAPMKGLLQPTIYRFQFGGFEVMPIMDSKAIRSGLTPAFGGEANADAVKALAKANRIDSDRYEHPFTPLLVNTGKELVLFDTGNGSLRDEYEQLKNRLPPGNLVARMGELGYKPEDVDVVVLTHGHPDHIGGLTKGGKEVFPNARYVFGATEFDYWNKGENIREARKLNRELYVKIVVPLGNKATMIKPGDEVVPGIRAVDCFGHSAGLMAFTIESEGKRMINWADTCNHYVVAIQRPDLQLDVDDDKEKAVATRKRILDMVNKEDMLVAGFHMPYPGIGYIDKDKDGTFRWVPHSYQMHL
jgi:glyoxylase-like metal-dependent hydrolase (beta-lactamase superfamily II)